MKPKLTSVEFEALARSTGLPLENVDMARLFEGHIKIQAMIDALNRPARPETPLAPGFALEVPE